jgi:hypothetical protein
MKSTALALSTLLAAPFSVFAGDYHQDHLIPAGSMMQCTVSEPKLSSKTESIGDPVLCRLSHIERFGRSVLPYNSFLVGRFEDYKDPGHFVGKGWMQLAFDHMVVEPDTIIPLDARVVDVPGFSIDHQGRILGKGHAVRDTIEWMIPVLWPIDLIELPRRGPRPTLKSETRLTLKVMDDVYVPQGGAEPDRDPYGLSHRPSAKADPPPVDERPAQQESAQAAPPVYSRPQPYYNAQPDYAPPQLAYTPPPVYVVQQPVYISPPPMYVAAQPVVVASAPVLMAPQAVYAYPQPAYATPPVYGAPAPSAYGYSPGPAWAPARISGLRGTYGYGY